MLAGWLLIFISIVYVVVLFAIAYFGDKRSLRGDPPVLSAWVYSLSLAVYCTSWTFYGAVGTAARSGWGYLPIYIGPILFFVFFWKTLDRTIRISKEQNITSIADFIAARYGRSQALAILVTIIALFGVIPYIALQLKAVAIGYDVLTLPGNINASDSGSVDTALLAALVLAVFSILFGTRYLDATENHHGMMLAIAFESLVKIFAFVAVALFATYGLFEGLDDVWTQIRQRDDMRTLFSGQDLQVGFITQTFLAFAAIFCLPRQFHVAVVENSSRNDLKTARWVLPLYLLLFTLAVVPIVSAGLIFTSAGVDNADQFVLLLPMLNNQPWLAALAFLGGFSAATGMVIVATVALSTMICNDVVVPFLLKTNRWGIGTGGDLSRRLLLIRRASIVMILLCAYAYYSFISLLTTPLASLGLMAFVAAAQFFPAMIGGLYWSAGNRHGALRGLIVGFALWLYTLFLPTLVRGGMLPQSLLDSGPAGIGWLNPEALLGFTGLDPVTHAVVWSLLANTLCYVFYSITSRQSAVEQSLANAFVHHAPPGSNYRSTLLWRSEVTVADLRLLILRITGRESGDRFFDRIERGRGYELVQSDRADVDLVRACEKQLAATIGASSSRVVMTSALRVRGMQVEDVEAMLDETSRVLSFNRELLHTTMQNMSQGVSVVDENLTLVAWNKQYLDLFDYPEGLVRVGRPVEDLVRFNAERGLCGDGDVKAIVERRLHHLRVSQSHSSERTRSDGKVIQIQGKPIAGGGFVTTFSDITEFRNSEKQLTEVNENLERRVSERTQALTEVNAALIQAKSAAEKANKSKTQFIAAASHDLLQPLNAAKLFTSALLQSDQADSSTRHALASNIDNSLTNTEHLLNSLLDISRLDAGAYHSKPRAFTLEKLFTSLNDEYAPRAKSKNVSFRYYPNSYTVYSDAGLVRRIMQNFISNAIRYATGGQVLLGCRYRRGSVAIEVWDNGPGIPEANLESIFEEFHRLPGGIKNNNKGLGLGLAITRRLAKVLDAPLEVRSTLGKGTVFSITLPIATGPAEVEITATPRVVGDELQGMRVLCIDNEQSILEGMNALCSNWGCKMAMASTLAGARTAFPTAEQTPDIVVVDYHLDDELTGVDILLELRKQWQVDVPAVVITADYTDELKQRVLDLGLHFMRKPLKPARLRALFNRVAINRRKVDPETGPSDN